MFAYRHVLPAQSMDLDHFQVVNSIEKRKYKNFFKTRTVTDYISESLRFSVK